MQGFLEKVPDQEHMLRRVNKRRALFALATITTVGLGTALYFNWIPLLQSGFGWDWHYRSPTWQSWLALGPFFIATAIYILGAWWLRRRSSFIFLGWIVIVGAIVCVSTLAAYGNPLNVLYERTVSANASGAFRIGIEFDSLIAGIRAWPETIGGDRYAVYRHMRLSPPGLPSVYWIFGRILEGFPAVTKPLGADVRSFFCDIPYVTRLTDAQLSATSFGILSPLWAMLTVIPLYDVVRQIKGDRAEAAARLAAATWLFVPAVIAFMGSHNTALPLLATLSLALFVRGWNLPASCRAAFWFATSGFMTFLCIVMNISMIPLILFCGVLTLLWAATDGHVRSRAYWRRCLLVGLQFGAGLALANFLYRLIAGYYLWDILPTIMGLHFDLERPYGPWLALHTRDMFLFFGLPFFIAWLYSGRVLPEGKAKRWSWALLITLLILTISGMAQGEVGRVWMFFMPPMLLPVAYVTGHYLPRRQQVGLIGLQLFWLVVGLVVLRPTLTFQPLPPDYDSVRYAPATNRQTVPVSARFGDEFILKWFQADFDQQNNNVAVYLGWEALHQMDESYLFSAVLVNDKGTIGGDQTWLPLNYRYPTTCWHQVQEEAVVDRIEMSLPGDSISGEWWISLSAFKLDEEKNPHYLPVFTADGKVDNQQVGIGPVATIP